MPNSENPGKGKRFQTAAARALSAHFGADLALDVPVPIGNPPKDHRFDLVSADRTLVGECKNCSWTETGNIPSAKMAFLNEAVLYLSLVPNGATRFIVMRRDKHPRRTESLAEYYYRTYRHLLTGVTILEMDERVGTITEVGSHL